MDMWWTSNGHSMDKKLGGALQFYIALFFFSASIFQNLFLHLLCFVFELFMLQFDIFFAGKIIHLFSGIFFDEPGHYAFNFIDYIFF